MPDILLFLFFLVLITYLFSCIANIFESFDVPNSKYDAMKYDFVYFCDVSYDNDEYFIEPYMSILDIHSINIKLFNVGMDENHRILYILKDVTPEKRRELEKILTKYSKSIRLDV